LAPRVNIYPLKLREAKYSYIIQVAS